MPSSCSKKIPERRFFKHGRNTISSSTPKKNEVLIPPSTSISDINTSSSEGAKSQKIKKKQIGKKKQKGRKVLQKKVEQSSMQKQISEEWETVNESLQETPAREPISEPTNIGEAGSSKNTQQLPQICNNDAFVIDLQSPEEPRRATNFIEDHMVSPILGSGIRRGRKREKGESSKGISFGDEEEKILTKGLKPSIGREREAVEKIEKSSLRKGDDLALGDVGTSTNSRRSPQLFTDLGSPKRIQISKSDVSFMDLPSPEEIRRATHLGQYRFESPIRGSGTRRSETLKRISFGDEEERVLTKRSKPSIRRERETTEETEKSLLRSSQQSPQLIDTDVLFTDLRSPKRTQIYESDVLFMDLPSPEEIRRATHFIQDRFESPIHRLETRRRNETPKKISGEEEVLLPTESLLPRLNDGDEVESPPLVLRRENTIKTYPASKQSKRYNKNISYDRHADVYSYMYFPNAYSDFLWDKFVSENYEKVKKYLAPANDKNQAPERKTLGEVLHPTSSDDDNAEIQKPKTFVVKYGKNMQVNVGAWGRFRGKWRKEYAYVTSGSEEESAKIMKKSMVRNKSRTKKRKPKDVYDFSSSSLSDEREPKRSKTVTMDSDYHQSATNEKRAHHSDPDDVSLPSTSKNTENSDESISSLKRVKKEKKLGNRKKSAKKNLSEIKDKPVITSIKNLRNLPWKIKLKERVVQEE